MYFSAKEIGSVSAAADIDAEFPVSSEDETVPEEENVPFQTYSECDPLALELRKACLPTPPRRKRASRAASTAPDPNPTTPPRRSAPDPPAASPSSPVRI